MRYRFGYLVTATVLFCIASTLQLKDSRLEVRGAMAQTPQRLLYSQSSFTTCTNQFIPQGWVIIRQIPSIQCSFGNAFVIKQPGYSELVCPYSPIPSNYVVTGAVRSLEGGKQTINALVIWRV